MSRVPCVAQCVCVYRPACAAFLSFFFFFGGWGGGVNTKIKRLNGTESMSETAGQAEE